MRKRISLKTRRRGLSRAECREYYETRHVPLGLSYIEHFQWQRYVRNHVCEGLGAAVPFDCVTEFWVADDADDDALARFIASEEFAALDVDDLSFLDTERRFSGEFDEQTIVASPPRDISPKMTSPSTSPSTKHVLYWLTDADTVDHEFERSRKFVTALGARVEGAILDRLQGPTPEAAPFDTLLWLELTDPAPITPPDELTRARGFGSTRVEPVETPAAQLYHPAG